MKEIIGVIQSHLPEEEEAEEVHVVQLESGGIPYDPFVTLNKNSAFARFVQLLKDQGVREPNEGESIDDYQEMYDSLLEHDADEEFIKANTKGRFYRYDTVRWWIQKMEK